MPAVPSDRARSGSRESRRLAASCPASHRTCRHHPHRTGTETARSSCAGSVGAVWRRCALCATAWSVIRDMWSVVLGPWSVNLPGCRPMFCLCAADCPCLSVSPRVAGLGDMLRVVRIGRLSAYLLYHSQYQYLSYPSIICIECTLGLFRTLGWCLILIL